MSGIIPASHGGRAGAHAMYALYAVSLLTGVPMLIGGIVAYLARGDAETIYRQHLQYGISTFWWSLLWVVIGVVLMLVLIGYVFLAIAWVFMAWRTARGWIRLLDERGPPGY